jgi:hypothetical protein
MAKERRPIERCRRKGATRWSNITLLDLGTKRAPKAKLPLDDPRAGVAKSSVHACSGKPVRPKLYGPVAVISTRSLTTSQRLTISRKYIISVFLINSSSSLPFSLQSSHTASNIMSCPFTNDPRSYPCLCNLRIASFISLAVGATNPWR